MPRNDEKRTDKSVTETVLFDSMEPKKLVEKWIGVQAKEIEVRAEELELEKIQLKNSIDYSKAALDAQVRDSQDSRSFFERMLRRLFWLIAFLALVVIAFFSYALSLGKEDIVLEIVKAIFYTGAGGLGGYGIKRFSEPSPGTEDEED